MTALSPRQREAMAAYIRLGSVKQAAYEMGCAEQTCKTHLQAARQRLGDVPMPTAIAIFALAMASELDA